MTVTERPRHVLFACVHDARRSQIAAAFFHALADPSRFVGDSAGLEPGAHVHPEDEIRTRVQALIAENGWGRAAPEQRNGCVISARLHGRPRARLLQDTIAMAPQTYEATARLLDAHGLARAGEVRPRGGA